MLPFSESTRISRIPARNGSWFLECQCNPTKSPRGPSVADLDKNAVALVDQTAILFYRDTFNRERLPSFATLRFLSDPRLTVGIKVPKRGVVSLFNNRSASSYV